MLVWLGIGGYFLFFYGLFIGLFMVVGVGICLYLFGLFL